MLSDHQQTPAQIAAAVPKSRKHETVEARYREMQTRRDELHEEFRAAVKANYGNLNEASVKKEILTLDAERKDLEKTMRSVAEQLRECRREHATRIADALELVRTSAASRAARALQETYENAVIVDDCAAQFIRAGGGDASFVPAITPVFGAMLFAAREQMRQIAGPE